MKLDDLQKDLMVGIEELAALRDSTPDQVCRSFNRDGHLWKRINLSPKTMTLGTYAELMDWLAENGVSGD